MQLIINFLTALLHASAIVGALVCIGASSCRLHKMDPHRTTKWLWLALYAGVFSLAWYALALLITRQASPFEAAVCVLAGAYMVATIHSWQQVPLICQKHYPKDPP